MTETKIVKSPSGRVKRAMHVAQGPLSVRGKEAGYQYRIVNDRDDRVLEFQEAGYELVQDKDVAVGTKRVDKAGSEGSVKMFPVGGGIKGVLMRIPQELYDEDQREKARAIDAQERAFKQDALNGYTGSIKNEKL